MQETIKVIIADRSGYVRLVMSDILNAEPGIEVVDTASDDWDILQKIELLKPDIIILDVKIPFAENLNLLKKTLRQNNTALIISGMEAELNKTNLSLQNTAYERIVKPDNLLLPQLRAVSKEVIIKV